MSASPRPQLGQLLLDRGLVSDEELEHALREQRETGEPLGEVLKRLRYVSAPELSDMLAVQRAWRPLGRMLVEKDLLSEDELEDVLAEQERTGARLGDIVRRRGLVSTAMLDELLAEQYRLEVELEHGFGAGLRGEIHRRHQLARGRGPLEPPNAAYEDGPRETPLHARLDSTSSRGEIDRITALQEALDDRERSLSALGAAHQRKSEEIEYLRAQLDERDALIATLQRQAQDRGGARAEAGDLRTFPRAGAR